MTETEPQRRSISAARSPEAVARSQKKSELVARQLIERIIAEDLDEGERLEHEGELIEQLGVSRATLREAFRLLEIAGILEMRPGRDGGAIVRHPSGEDFGRMVTLFFQITRVTYRDLMKATILIQPAINAHAARTASEGDKERLRSLWRERNGRPRNDDDDVESLLGLAEVVAEASHNPVITLIVSAIGSVFLRHMDEMLVSVPQRREGARVARLIVEAIENGDGDRAARLSLANLEGWAEIAEREYPHILDSVVRWDH